MNFWITLKEAAQCRKWWRRNLDNTWCIYVVFFLSCTLLRRKVNWSIIFAAALFTSKKNHSNILPPKRTSNMVEGKLWFCTCCFGRYRETTAHLQEETQSNYGFRRWQVLVIPPKKAQMTDIIMIFLLSMVRKSGDHHLGCINPDNNGIN